MALLSEQLLTFCLMEEKLVEYLQVLYDAGRRKGDAASLISAIQDKQTNERK